MRLAFVLIFLGFVCPTLCCSQGEENQCNTWVKLNTSPVCFSAKGNRPGSFTPTSHGFLKAVKLKHLNGYVSCVGNTRAHDSNWGCKNSASVRDAPLNVFVTNKLNKVMFPLSGVTYNARYAKTAKYYGIQGYDAMSPELILEHGCNSPSDYIGPGSQLRVWFGEDLFNTNEFDNSGRACVDVYGNFCLIPCNK